MLALTLAEAKGTIKRDEYVKVVEELTAIPEKIKEVLKSNDAIADLARTFTYAHNFLYLGRGFSYPVALEGALKLKGNIIYTRRRLSSSRDETWAYCSDRL